jgi:predicted small integral membrane protein
MNLDWMAWTWATAGFFAFIVLCLVTLTLIAIRWPETPRRGVLGFPTTRGDRLFVSLIGTAWLFIAFIWLGGDVLWYPLGGAFLWWVAMFRYA